MTHTPGPWHRNIKPVARYPIIFAGRNTHVAQVVNRGLPDDEAEANCDLIAAAPTLLSNLQYVASCVAVELDELAPDEPVEVVMTAEGLRQLLNAVAALESPRP